MGGQAMAHMQHIGRAGICPRMPIVLVMLESVTQAPRKHTPNPPMFGRI